MKRKCSFMFVKNAADFFIIKGISLIRARQNVYKALKCVPRDLDRKQQ